MGEEAEGGRVAAAEWAEGGRSRGAKKPRQGEESKRRSTSDGQAKCRRRRRRRREISFNTRSRTVFSVDQSVNGTHNDALFRALDHN